MDERVHVEAIPSSLGRPLRRLGLTLGEWAVVILGSGGVLLYTAQIPRMLGFLKFSHALFLSAALLLYTGLRGLHAGRPPRDLTHALRFAARPKYLIACGFQERKTVYWTS